MASAPMHGYSVWMRLTLLRGAAASATSAFQHPDRVENLLSQPTMGWLLILQRVPGHRRDAVGKFNRNRHHLHGCKVRKMFSDAARRRKNEIRARDDRRGRKEVGKNDRHFSFLAMLLKPVVDETSSVLTMRNQEVAA